MFSTRPPAAEDFARLSDAILNAAIAGAFSSLSSISARIRRSVASGGFDAGLRLNNAGAGSFDGGAGGGDWAFADSSAARALCGRAIVIQLLGGDGATLGEGVGANMAFRRGIQLRPGAASLPLRWHAFHFVADRARLWRPRTALSASLICAAASRRCSFSTRVSILASTSPSVHELTLFDQNGVDTPGDFTGNINFGGFDSAVAAGKPRRESRRAQQPPCGGGEHHQ